MQILPKSIVRLLIPTSIIKAEPKKETKTWSPKELCLWKQDIPLTLGISMLKQVSSAEIQIT